MVALITGASSGIGRDMARYLSTKGYDLIINGRNEDRLKELKDEIESSNSERKVSIIVADLNKEEECLRLHEEVKNEFGTIDILVNNAGFGLFGEFVETSLQTELAMIRTNVEAVHILTKLFLQDMQEMDRGRILNVASVAGFMPGPLMATYYATKNYVFRLSQAIKKELAKKKSNVKISVLCPGPVDTNFNNVAGGHFSINSKTSEFVGSYAIRKMFKKKLIIVPGLDVKLGYIAGKFLPIKLVLKVLYKVEHRKRRVK